MQKLVNGDFVPRSLTKQREKGIMLKDLILREAKMKGHNMFVRIVAILLCAVMVLGVVTVAFYSFMG